MKKLSEVLGLNTNENPRDETRNKVNDFAAFDITEDPIEVLKRSQQEK